MPDHLRVRTCSVLQMDVGVSLLILGVCVCVMLLHAGLTKACAAF